MTHRARSGAGLSSGTGLRTALRLIVRAGPAHAAGLGLCAVLLGIGPVASAWMLKLFVDGLVADARTPYGWWPIVGLAAAALITLVAPAVSSYLAAELERRVQVEASSELFTAIARLPGLRPFEDPVFFNRLALAQRAGETSPPVVLSVGFTVVADLVGVIGFMVTLAVISPVVAALAVASAVPAVLVQRLLSRRQAVLSFGLSPHDRRRFFYGNLQTDARAAKEIRVLGLGRHLLSRMLTELGTMNDAERRLSRVELRLQTGLAVLAGGLMVAALVAIATSARGGAVSVGDVLVVVAALVAVQTATTSIASSVGHVYEAVLQLEHFDALLSAEPDLTLTGTVRCPPLAEGIRFDDVWFRYSPEHPWILRGFTLDLTAGSSTALVGLNGAGKSTVMKLLCRLYDPERGVVRWNGVDLRDLELSSLRERVAVVFQDFMTYDLSVADNIGLGDLTRLDDRGEIETAATTAGVAPAVAALPYGYDTVLSRSFVTDLDEDGDGVGVDLSGGQWQRVALARMLMRSNADLMILDEPSSGLDAEAEHAVHRRLTELRQGRTSLLVSHRLSAVAAADRIAVLEGGRIVEEGTHHDLMAASGTYAALFTLQAAGYVVPAKRATTTPTSSDEGTGPHETESALEG